MCRKRHRVDFYMIETIVSKAPPHGKGIIFSTNDNDSFPTVNLLGSDCRVYLGLINGVRFVSVVKLIKGQVDA